MKAQRARSPRPNSIAACLLDWFDSHRRALPWRALPRETPDPYAVWLSEIMLQQTTVAAVKPYYAAFLARWPKVSDLAAAQDEAVMQAWAGLGYYARARNMLACARKVVAEHGGQFPASEAALRALPGVGAYTAAAIAAIAFGQRAVVVDGNVERVVARLYALDEPLPAAKRAIAALTDTITPDARAGDFAQAMMDLGSGICTPKSPKCLLCPLAVDCAALKSGDPASFPRRASKAARPARVGTVFVAIAKGKKVLLRTRPPKGLLGGMSEFPGTEWTTGSQSDALDSAPLAAQWTEAGHVDHVFTHFSLRLRVLRAEVSAKKMPDDGRWVDIDALSQEALPSLMRKVAKASGLA